MDFEQFKALVRSDLYRISPKNTSFRRGFSRFFGDSAYKYTFLLRSCAFFRKHKALKFTLYPIARFLHSHYSYKYGIDISPQTQLGSGFYIGHYGCIVVHTDAVIGKNCNISQGVTIGQTNRGSRSGTPVLGDNVYIGPGAKIIGGIKIGDNVAIGANSVVTKDVPSNGVVVGIPGKVISFKGSDGYVNNTGYDAETTELDLPREVETHAARTSTGGVVNFFSRNVVKVLLFLFAIAALESSS